MEHDQKKAAEAKQQSTTAGSQSDGVSAHRAPSLQKEPSQVLLYGFSISSQPDAIKFYETASGGMICEDYDREPPHRIPSTYSSSASAQHRALTTAESHLAKQYRGGDHWIKVTFDSAEAAERAIEASPHVIGGHYVYAQEFRGVGPDVDQPLLQPHDMQSRGFSLSNRPAQTVGPSFTQRPNFQSRNATTLPRSFTSNATLQVDHHPDEAASLSSSTASSATAISPNQQNFRSRQQSQTQNSVSSLTPEQNGQIAPRPDTYTYFPDMPKAVIYPASEAFLPQATWSERVIQRLVKAGWFPGDFIGDGPPRMENGDFDYANASVYWRLMNWIDSIFGSDLCGNKD